VAERLRAVQAVNTTLIDLYWQVGTGVLLIKVSPGH
jgi:hypothetical protein